MIPPLAVIVSSAAEWDEIQWLSERKQHVSGFFSKITFEKNGFYHEIE
jgi:hypothetical protein